MAPSPGENAGTLVTLTVFSGGTVINSSIQILSVEVHHEVNFISTTTVELIDGNVATQDFPISNSSDFLPGNKIKITAGYDSTESIIFEGIIIKHGLKCDSSGNSVLTFECKSEAVKMTIGRKNDIYTDIPDSDLISKVICNYGLTATVDPTSNQMKEVVQYYCTDWDFILSRAKINGMFVFTSGSTVSISKPKLGAAPVLSVKLGDSIHEFDLETYAPTVDGAIKSLADDQLLKSGLAKIRGTVSFQGSSVIMPGNLLKIAGVGDRFSGDGFVRSVTHRIKDGDWITEAGIGLPQDWFMEGKVVAAPIASGLVPGIEGLQIGIVKQLDQDPYGENLILVSLPVMQSNAGGII